MQVGQAAHFDDSDWWSITREDTWAGGLKPGNKDLAPTNFQILGFDLGTQFEDISVKLGKAQPVSRGDGATGREQVCYVSTNHTGPKVHLVFESGELNAVFYLFADGTDWKGSNLCVSSNQVSPALRTPSGLRLGLTRAELETLLGKPDRTTADKVIYYREVKTKTTVADFERIRKNDPEKLSDKEAHERWDFYTAEVYIEARFSDSRLNYLAVSRAGFVD
jgi:hypothetical protein